MIFKLASTERIVDEMIEDVVKTCSDSSEKGKLLEEKWGTQLNSCQEFLSKTSFFGMKLNKLERYNLGESLILILQNTNIRRQGGNSTEIGYLASLTC